MAKIIRHDQVDVSGSFQLNGSGQAAVVQPAVVTEVVVTPESQGAQVRVVEQNEQVSILEVTCACGEVIQIQCEHQAVP